MELYVCRDVYFCMFNPPYPVPTHFVRVAELDTWLARRVITMLMDKDKGKDPSDKLFTLADNFLMSLNR